jgi:hypothetical protein
MNKTSSRPPIVSFLLAFIGLVAAALFLAALAPTPELSNDSTSSLAPRNSTPEAMGAGRADRTTTGSAR